MNDRRIGMFSLVKYDNFRELLGFLFLTALNVLLFIDQPNPFRLPMLQKDSHRISGLSRFDTE